MTDMAGRGVTHADIANRLDRGDGKFVAIEARLGAIEAAQAQSLEQQERTNELLEAWIAMKGLGNFIIWWGKVFGGLIVIGTAILTVLKLKLLTVLGANG
jgi:hypothetical protein